MSDLIFPIESSLYVKRGVNTIIDGSGNHNWYPTLFLGRESNPNERKKNPNDVFIIIEENRVPRKTQNPRPRNNNNEDKYRIYLDTFEWYKKNDFMSRLKKFAEFCYLRKITIFGMIYAYEGYKDNMSNMKIKTGTIKIILKKGNAIDSPIDIVPRQINGWLGKSKVSKNILDIGEHGVPRDNFDSSSDSSGGGDLPVPTESRPQKKSSSSSSSTFSSSSSSQSQKKKSSSSSSSTFSSSSPSQIQFSQVPPQNISSSSSQSQKKSNRDSQADDEEKIRNALDYIKKHSKVNKKRSQNVSQDIDFTDSSDDEGTKKKKKNKTGSQIDYETPKSPKKRYDSDDDPFLDLLKK